MKISDNVLRHYLKNCYFIIGTAYAGKSTMCKMLSERYGMVHCEENYNMDMILSVVTEEDQPNFSYFNTKPSWQHYVSRSPEAFEAWYDGNSREVADFEVAELIRLSGERKVIVDTNIPVDILKDISDYRHVAVMLSPQSTSVDRFFDRDDPEKQFLLSEIARCPDPEWALDNFRACIARVNSPERCEKFAQSGFFTIERPAGEWDSPEKAMKMLAVHFGLADQEDE